MTGAGRPRGLLRLTGSLMRGRFRRLAATVLAVVAGVAFATASIVVTASLRASAEDAVAAGARAADVVVTPRRGQDDARLVAAVGQVPGVVSVEPVREDYLDVELSGTPTLSRVRSLPVAPSLRSEQLTSGRWPAAPGGAGVGREGVEKGGLVSGGQPVVDREVVEKGGLVTGGQLVVHPAGRPVVTVTVVGVANPPDSVGGGVATVFAADRDVAAWTAAPVEKIYLLGVPGVDRAELRDQVAAAGAGAAVRTGEQQAARELTGFTGGSDVLTAGLQAAAGMGLLVAALVIANTFQVVVAQRAREYALLRCIGARRGQLVGIVLREAGLVGLGGSAIGLLVGAGAGTALTAVLSGAGTALPLTRTVVPVGPVVAAGLVGVATTVLAVLGAAAAAARHRPLEALRDLGVDGAEARTHPGRVVVGGLLLIAGGWGLVLGAQAGSIALTVPAGAVAACGALLLVRPLVAAVLRVLRVPLAACGEPARLAWANLTRNPRRAAAASTALLVGITLVATVLVGVASTRATLTSEIDARYPVDAEVLAVRGTLPSGLARDLTGGAGVAGLAVLNGTTVRIGGVERPVLAAADDARRVGRSGLVTPAPGELLLPPAVAQNARIAAGDPVRLASGTGEVVLLARVGTADLGAPLVAPADLARLDRAAGPHAIWLRTNPHPDAATVTESIRSATSASGADAILNGAVRLRTAYQGVLDTATLVALGLLAISVVIAVIGIANTLTLSVLERRRESALLRALGLTRARLRISLAWEAVVIGLAGTVGGLLLGCAFGVAGSYALLEFGTRTVPELPVVQLVGVAAAATVLAVLASTLPARLALRSTPAQGLTVD